MFGPEGLPGREKGVGYLWRDTEEFLNDGPCSAEICHSQPLELIMARGYKLLNIRLMSQDVRMYISQIQIGRALFISHSH